ncbi:MAG TPA: hypothetical protein VGO21_05990 [Candidatus Paceibacterota bacterium]|jgi:hypothetical protein|nr:hypothetical protein [Candidatus Paceibacterota bacterium]
MQHDITKLELPALYDLLAVYTTKYTQMLRNHGATPDFKECQDTILKLQTEIDLRNAQFIRDNKKELGNDEELIPALA